MPDSFPLPTHRNTKVFVAIDDIPDNGGCTALVPRTHRLPSVFLPNNGRQLRRGYRSHSASPHAQPDALPQTSMPGLVKMALPAGSAFVFDTAVSCACVRMCY